MIEALQGGCFQGFPPIPSGGESAGVARSGGFRVPEGARRPPGVDSSCHGRRPTGSQLDQALRINELLWQADRSAALGRRALGLLARRFLSIHGDNGLGFSSLGDWSRERLGLSGREIQVLAKVFSNVDSLPRIESAFLSGEISWTKLRILSAVATTEDSERWLTVALYMTTRELEAEARRVVKASSGPGDGTVSRNDRATARKATTAIAEISDDEGETVEGEEKVSFRLSVSRRLLRLWKEVLELGRRMNGVNGPVWKLAESIAAEGLSAVPAEALDEEALTTANASSIPAQTDGRARVAGPGPRETVVAQGLDPGFRRGGEEGRGAEPASFRRTPESSRGVKSRPGAVIDGPDDDPFALDLDAILDRVDDLDAFTLDARMRRVVRALNVLEIETGRLLRRMADRKLHVALGYPRLDDYARERLGISPRTVWSLVAIARKASDVPALDRALRNGKLSRARALTLLPVLSPRDPEAASAWTDRARQVMVRRVADEVGWALDLHDPENPSRRLLPPPLGSRLERPELQMRASSTASRAERPNATIAFSGPATVVSLFRIAAKAFDPTGEDFRAGFERLLWHVRNEWRGQPRHRDPIFERDGWRCTVPGCSKRSNFHSHHVIERRYKVSDEPWNLTAVCAAHHLRGIHKGLVRCKGRAPDQIHWQLGVRPGNQPPLLDLEGDVYVVHGAENVAAA